MSSYNQFNDTPYLNPNTFVLIHIWKLLQVKFPVDADYIYTRHMSKFCVSVFVDCVVAVVGETALCIS